MTTFRGDFGRGFANDFYGFHESKGQALSSSISSRDLPATKAITSLADSSIWRTRMISSFRILDLSRIYHLIAKVAT